MGPLLVATLGVATPAIGPCALAQTSVQPRVETITQEIVITASREADEALRAQVVEVLRDDPYIFADHISVVTENGVVRLRGFALDASDLRRALRLAHRVAGRRRVVNEVELMAISSDID
jgi:osmotically-inducible protein OsmY